MDWSFSWWCPVYLQSTGVLLGDSCPPPWNYEPQLYPVWMRVLGLCLVTQGGVLSEAGVVCMLPLSVASCPGGGVD